MTYTTSNMNKRSTASTNSVLPVKNGKINGIPIGSNGNEKMSVRTESNGDIRINGSSQVSKLSTNFDNVLSGYHNEDGNCRRAFRWVIFYNAFLLIYHDFYFPVNILPSVRLRYVEDIRLNLIKIMLNIDNYIV